jgi:hypothetical protein
MFDFLRWRGWLDDRAEELRSRGFETELRMSDKSPKPGTALNLTRKRILASFAIWETGEADYDVADEKGELFSHEWGLMLDDLNFEAAFKRFIGNVRSREIAEFDRFINAPFMEYGRQQPPMPAENDTFD